MSNGSTRITRVVPAPPVQLEIGDDDLADWLTAEYALPGDEWLRLNLISALGGQITGPSGTSDDLADGIDRPLLKALRGMADVVLVGAASVRAAGYTLPRRAPLAVATISGDLAGHVFADHLEPDRLLVLCPAAAVDRVRSTVGDRATIILVEDPQGDPASLLAALRARDLGRIVCEGGGALASRLLAADQVTEFCHSVAPVIASPGAPLVTGIVPIRVPRLAGMLLDSTERTYSRWSFAAFEKRLPVLA